MPFTVFDCKSVSIYVICLVKIEYSLIQEMFHMDRHALLKVLTSAGVAASLVAGTDAVKPDTDVSTEEASDTASHNDKGGTGHDDGHDTQDHDRYNSLH